MKFEIPIAPTAQQRARHARRNGISMEYKSRSQKAHEADLHKFLVALAPSAPLSGYLRLDMRAFLPIPDSWPASKKKRALEGRIRPASRPDLDNYDKQLWDAMTRAGWWKDDALVVEGWHGKYYSDRPRWEVEVMQLGVGDDA